MTMTTTIQMTTELFKVSLLVHSCSCRTTVNSERHVQRVLEESVLETFYGIDSLRTRKDH